MSQEMRPEGQAAAAEPPEGKKYLTVRQAAFIGIRAIAGAGIFALLGATGEVAGRRCGCRS